MDITLRSDKGFPIDRWLQLYKAAGYNDWWTERNAEAALSYAYVVVTTWEDDAAMSNVQPNATVMDWQAV